jgi:hypothetical protein
MTEGALPTRALAASYWGSRLAHKTSSACFGSRVPTVTTDDVGRGRATR